MSVSVDGLSDAIMQELMEWCEEEEDIAKKELDKIADEIVNDLKNNPDIPERTGKYKKSFYKKTVADGLGYKRIKIANRRWWLTHIIEKKHLTRDGTKEIDGHPHWGPAEKKLEELTDKMERKL